jgi:hypothetical protein
MPQSVKVSVFTLAILLCVGIALSTFRGSLEKIAGRSNITPVFSYLNIHNNRDAEAIFLGSSRFVSCIKTDLFANLSGMEPTNVLNLATDSGRSWEELLLSRKYPGLLDASPLVIIEVEPWMFNNNLIHPIYKKPFPFEQHFYTWATFQERLEYPDPIMKLLLLADYVWPFSERRSLNDWVSIVQSMINSKYVEPHLSIPAYHYNLEAFQALANSPTFFAQNIAQDHMNNYEFAEYKAEYLKRLIHLAEKRAKKIILLQPPVRKEYMSVIYNNPKYTKTYIQYLQFIHSMERENVHSIIWEMPKDCGLNDSIFVDYGHFNLHGAYIFTQRLFVEMKNRKIIQ